MRGRLALGAGLAVLALGTVAAAGHGHAARPAPAAGSARTVTASPAVPRATRTRTAVTGPAPAARPAAGACDAFPRARQLPGASTIRPAAWTGDGVTVPACGPAPGAGARSPGVAPYPGAPPTPGYQCVELAERYLYARFGVTMDARTNGDQVAAHYAADYAALFSVVVNGTPHRAPAPGDVISLSTVPGFDSASGGHSVIVASSAVGATGDGTVTVIEENASASGVTMVPVEHWRVRYPGFRYAEWLKTNPFSKGFR